MKGFHRLLSLMLVMFFTVFLMLAPLGAAAESGGYVEQELTMPEGYAQFSNPAALPGGGFVVAALRADTGAWELLTFASLTEVQSAIPLDTSLGEISAISVAPDGLLAATLLNLPRLAGGPGEGPGKISAGDPAGGPADGPAEGGQPKQRVVMGPDDMATTVVWYQADGTVSASFTVQGMLLQAVALSGQRLAAQGMTGVTLYDAAGKTELSIDRNDISNLAAAGDSLYMMQADKISQLDLTGNVTRSVPWTRDYSEQWAVAPDGTLALVNATGIYRLGPDGVEMERVADTARYLIGAPDSGLSGLCALADGTLLAYLNGSGMTLSGGGGTFRVGSVVGGDSAKLVAYVYDAQLDTSASIDFAVTALRDSAKLRKAVNDFQRAHPELNVRLDTALAEGDTDTPVEDAIRALNTNLLAGKGGDVLILDELPLRQYIQKGVLAPLDEILADVDFLPGILQGSRAQDGKLYAMPAQFQFSTLWGNREKVQGIDSLAALVALPLDNAQDLLIAHTPEELLGMFYPASQAAFLGENGTPRFDTPEFEGFLEALYSIYAAQAALPDTSFAASGPVRMTPEELQGMMNGSIALMGADIDGTMQTALPYTMAGAKDGAFLPVPALNGAGVTYTPALLMGINANTQHEDMATEFLRSLFSPEIQGLDQMEGLPTVAASLSQMIEEAKARNKEKNMVMMISTGSGNPIQMEQPDDETWDALLAAAGTLTEPYIADPTLMGFIVEETASFFEGQASAQDAALAIEQRAAAYLNE